MRQLTLIITTVSLLVGGVPQKISYQGYVTHADGTLVSDGSYDVKFRLFQANEGGDALWEESQTITIGSGLISATLGGITALNFSENMHFLEIEINGEVLAPRQELTTVFYAFHAESAVNAATANLATKATKSDTATYATKSGSAELATKATTADTALYSKATVPVSIGDLSDVDLTDVSDGKILKYDGTNTKFVVSTDATGASGTTSLSDLSDVDLTNVADGKILKYSSESSKFVISDDATATSGSTATSISDADSDTKVQVEESSDEDKIRFDIGGTEKFVMEGSRLAVLNTGYSVFIGDSAGINDDLSNNDNVFIGYRTGYTNTTGDLNTAVGYHALKSNTTASSNTAFGATALFSNTTGNSNTAIGSGALSLNTTGHWNTANGFASLFFNTTGSNNTATGYKALQKNTTGGNNTATGEGALSYNTTGSSNTASGYGALGVSTAADYNTAVGSISMVFSTTGTLNTAVGAGALAYNSEGYSNVAIGSSSLGNSTTGAANVALGAGLAGSSLSTGSGNLLLGYGTNVSGSAAYNQIAVGYLVSGTGDNEIALGNSLVSAIKAQVTSITSYSDSRIKRDITDTDLGLAFINELRPVKYRRKNPADYPEPLLEARFRSIQTPRQQNSDRDYNGMVSQSVKASLDKLALDEGLNSPQNQRPSDDDNVYDGLIAQEVKAALDELGLEWSGWSENQSDGKQGIQYGALVVPLIKAVQELSDKVDRLEKQVQ